ncbi:uncharacterized protein LOC143811948 [Ranitomeya variabilis]|uniref:uncharacterized protein LOC143811948 n=1 Tax=Ranitomeya variabilis TaxID=490064 RepID=UPI00405763F3
MERFTEWGLQTWKLWQQKTRFLQFRQQRIHQQPSTSSFFIRSSAQEAQLTDNRRRPTRRGHYNSSRADDNTISGRTINSVINISDYTLTPSELTVLQRGLSFCPTPPWGKFRLDQDLQCFFRSIRLKTHFGLQQDPLTRNTTLQIPELSISMVGLRNVSSFNPPRGYHTTETYIDLTQKDINQVLEQHSKGAFPTRNNISDLEKQAIQSLKSNKHITIKPADKGGAIVIMNQTDYIREIKNPLSDVPTYKRITHDPTSDIKRKIESTLNRYLTSNTIDQKTATFLINQHPVTPVFYILPKIHKSLTNPPG